MDTAGRLDNANNIAPRSAVDPLAAPSTSHVTLTVGLYDPWLRWIHNPTADAATVSVYGPDDVTPITIRIAAGETHERSLISAVDSITGGPLVGGY